VPQPMLSFSFFFFSLSDVFTLYVPHCLFCRLRETTQNSNGVEVWKSRFLANLQDPKQPLAEFLVPEGIQMLTDENLFEVVYSSMDANCKARPKRVSIEELHVEHKKSREWFTGRKEIVAAVVAYMSKRATPDPAPSVGANAGSEGPLPASAHQATPAPAIAPAAPASAPAPTAPDPAPSPAPVPPAAALCEKLIKTNDDLFRLRREAGIYAVELTVARQSCVWLTALAEAAPGAEDGGHVWRLETLELMLSMWKGDKISGERCAVEIIKALKGDNDDVS
jgi:hypothetical protein